MESRKNDVIEAIEKSAYILIGIGEEMGIENFSLDDCDEYKKFIEKKEKEKAGDEMDWIMAFIRNWCIRKKYENRMQDFAQLEAYRILFERVKDKNYFLVTTNFDSLVYHSPFDAERIVSPCGNREMLQCSDNCSGKIWDSHEEEKRIIGEIMKEDVLLGSIETPKCPDCHKDAVLHTIRDEHYFEEAYLPQWDKYTRWLQGTINRDLCILELGVGFKFPTVIRWPFEKIAYLNKKADFFRINSKFPQLTEELKEKGVSIDANPAAFIRSLQDA